MMVNEIIKLNDNGVDGKDLILTVAVYDLRNKIKRLEPKKRTEYLLNIIYELQDKGKISMKAKKISRK